MSERLIVIKANEADVSSDLFVSGEEKNTNEILLPVSNILQMSKQENGAVKIWLKRSHEGAYLYISNAEYAKRVYEHYRDRFMWATL